MLNLEALRDLFVNPALDAVGLNSKAAMRLVIGTGLVESGYHYQHQLGGPALGFWQMEPVTAKDNWDNFLDYHPKIKSAVETLLGPDANRITSLVYNPGYAIAMCRIKYYRSPMPLPDANDLNGLAQYWLTEYNSGGKGVAQRFVDLARDANLMSL